MNNNIKNIKEWKRVIILNLVPNTIGDTVLLTKIFPIIKHQIPGIKIGVTVSPLNKDLLEDNPYLDDLLIIDSLRWIARTDISRPRKAYHYIRMWLETLKKLKAGKYDVAFILLPNFFPSQLLPAAAGIKKSFGYSYRSSIFSHFVMKTVKYRGLIETQDYTRHFLESYYDLMRVAGFEWDDEKFFASVTVTKTTNRAVKTILENLKIVTGKYIVIHCGSKTASWPSERFKKLISSIRKRTKMPIILLGSDKESKMNEEVKKGLNKVYNLAGKPDLKEVAGLIKKAKFSICNDSGIAHLSSAVGTTAIILYGPHHPNHCIPKGKGKIFKIYKYSEQDPYVNRDSKEAIDRIKAISVQDILDLIDHERLLQ